MKKHSISLIISIFLLHACSSNPSQPIDTNPITITQAKAQHTSLKGTKVQWSGSILSTKNFKDYSLIEILKRPRSGTTEPDDKKKGEGRFIAKVSGFIDPAEYKTPSRIAITGTLQGIKVGRIGDYIYTYPLVMVENHQFWKGKKATYTPTPYWYDYPFQPYYNRWPYHRSHFHSWKKGKTKLIDADKHNK